MFRISKFLVIGFFLATPVAAEESVTYTYDALGRLVKAETAGGPNDQLKHQTTYDPAGNRSNYKVENARLRVVVLPLNGFTIIPIEQ